MSKPALCPWCGRTCVVLTVAGSYAAVCYHSGCNAMGPARETPEHAAAAMEEVVQVGQSIEPKVSHG